MSTLKAKHFHLIEDMDIAALTFAAWIRRHNDRRLLAMMNERMLNDIGLSNHEVQAEVAKYFWQQ
jgi:uncharacterized protein YjiS (DUF1127 family)